jgi:hypothetical protein
MASNRCDGKFGVISGRCRLEGLHPGNHDNGNKTWPRSPSEEGVYAIALQVLDERKRQQAERTQLIKRHERGEL